MNEKEFLEHCIEYFGEDKQMVVCIEEMAELTQQLSKFVIDHPKKDRDKLVEEYVDVIIMLHQMKIIFDIQANEVDVAKTFKLNRLNTFIENNPK